MGVNFTPTSNGGAKRHVVHVSPAQKKNTNARLLAIVVLVALALRLAVISLPNFEDLMDADHIHAWEPGNVAESLVAGKGFGSSFLSSQPAASLPPLYPLIVAFFFLIFGVHTAHSILAIHIFDCVVNSLACIPIFLVARRSFSERVAKWAAWGWAIFPYGIYFSAAWAWGTHLLLLGLCWLLYLSQDMERSSRPGLWAGFGFLAGLTGLAEPSVFTVVPFLMLLACWRLARDRKRWFMPAAVASVALIATISPWMIRNAIVFHRFIPMRGNAGLELWMGNNGEDLRWTSDELNPLHNQAELAKYDELGEVAYMQQKAAEAKLQIRNHPGWYAWMCARRAVYLWTGFWSFNPVYLSEEPMDPPNIPFATLFSLFGLTGLYLAWRAKPHEAVRYGLVLFIFPAMYYFSHPEPYDMRPLDPLLLMLGCYAVYKLRGLGKTLELVDKAERVAPAVEVVD
ncbi:MAG TPA: glycosyltransferase family 39 protein [Terracidiphilus sp.]|nr:glycosyltransferase family 39 protein [Terracidiphilus sp.]